MTQTILLLCASRSLALSLTALCNLAQSTATCSKEKRNPSRALTSPFCKPFALRHRLLAARSCSSPTGRFDRLERYHGDLPLILHRGQHKIIDIFHGRQNGKLPFEQQQCFRSVGTNGQAKDDGELQHGSWTTSDTMMLGRSVWVAMMEAYGE